MQFFDQIHACYRGAMNEKLDVLRFLYVILERRRFTDSCHYVIYSLLHKEEDISWN